MHSRSPYAWPGCWASIRRPLWAAEVVALPASGLQPVAACILAVGRGLDGWCRIRTGWFRSASTPSTIQPAAKPIPVVPAAALAQPAAGDAPPADGGGQVEEDHGVGARADRMVIGQAARLPTGADAPALPCRGWGSVRPRAGHALVHSVHGRCHGDVPVGDLADLACLRAEAAGDRDLEAVDGPAVRDKVRDVVGLYLDPPDNALVLAVDTSGRAGARHRWVERRVSPARPPNPACPSPSTGLSTD
jgi:hypothetical protein